MAQDKWLSDLSPDDPVTHAARQALHDRLTTVVNHLPMAAEQAADDIEHVHQLRVASRRARTALELFQDFPSSKRTRWMAKRMRQLRKAANDARDLDVLLERLMTQPADIDKNGIVELVMEIATRRHEAQQPLIAVVREQGIDDLERHVRALCKSVKWRGAGTEPTFRVAARDSLGPLVDQFFVAARDDLSDPQKLHQLRIAGKRVRYALELLSSAFDTSVREAVYPVFEEVQKKLGLINDYATAKTLYADWMGHAGPKAKELLERLAAHEARELAKTSRAFRRWWTDKRCQDMQQMFLRLLGRVDTERNGLAADATRNGAALNGEALSGEVKQHGSGNGEQPARGRRTKPRG